MAAANLIDSAAAKRYEAVPVAFTDDKRALVVAMADPANVLAVDDIAMLTRLDVKPAVGIARRTSRRSSRGSTASATPSARRSTKASSRR